MVPTGFWLRWSWRDWRARWIQIAIIALIIALGTGGYSGMISSVEWREQSQTANFEALNMYDLRIRLATGSYVDEGRLRSTLEQIAHPESIQAAEERLLSVTQVKVETQDETILAVGPIVGVDVSAGGPSVNRIHTTEGRSLTADDAGRDIVLISGTFGTYNDLPASGQLDIGGDRELTYVGHGLSPEYFSAIGGIEYGGFLTPSVYAPLFMPLETAQQITGQAGQVNDLVIALQPGTDREAIADEIETTFERELPELGFQIMYTEDDPSYQVIFDDIDNDRQLLTIFAFLIFLGAVGAAFNLTSRLVDSQRREIGIAMSLGVPRYQIAFRPLLFGAEIAALGVLFGVIVGIVLGWQMQGLLKDIQPLPNWQFDFQISIFAQAAIVGFLLPFLATSIPVLRAVRVPPIRAMQPAYQANRSSGLAPLISWLNVPGTIFAQIPIRNVLRAPRRSLLTMLGVAAAITVLVGLLGTLDAFFNVLDRSDEAVLADSPSRIELALNGFQPVESEAINRIRATPSIGELEPGLRLGAQLAGDDVTIDVLLEFIDFQNDIWHPTVEDGSLLSAEPGILIARKAADDLGVGVGDVITVRHPQRTGPTSFTLAFSELPIVGIHTSPLRSLAYMDMKYADIAGLAGTTNLVHVTPTPDAPIDQVMNEMFELEAVTLAQPVAEINESIQDLFESFTGILQTFQGLALFLALLIAFNAASINLDERSRDYATMFAFGLPIRTVMRMTMIESALVGLGGTIIGTIGGYLVIRWILDITATTTLEDVGMEIIIDPTTVALTIALGILAVAAAPLFTIRKLQRMNISSTLRLME